MLKPDGGNEVWVWDLRAVGVVGCDDCPVAGRVEVVGRVRGVDAEFIIPCCLSFIEILSPSIAMWLLPPSLIAPYFGCFLSIKLFPLPWSHM